MNIIAKPGKLNTSNKKICLAIGMFNGVHLSHQQVIHQTITNTEHCNSIPMVVTFDHHPNTIITPDRVPPLIYNLPQKLRTIETLSTDAIWLIAFNTTFNQHTNKE